jgi:uncharacterized membrane protein YccC
LSTLTTGLVIWLVAKVAGVSVRSLSAGVMVSIFGVVMVRESGWAQHVTSAAMVACSCLSAALAAALLPWWRWQAGVFLAVIFVAVYARRFGPRWAAAGMAAYVSYLLVCYVRTPLTQVAWQGAGIAIGAAVADLWRAALLREPPGQVLVSVARAIELKVGLLLAEIEHAQRRKTWSSRRRRRLLRGQNLLAQDLALIEQQLGALCADEDARAWALRRAFFELHLAALSVARLALRRPPCSWPAPRRTAELARAFLRDGQGRRAGAPSASPEADEFSAALARLAASAPLPPLASALAADRRASRPGGAPAAASPAPPAAGAAPVGGHGLSAPLRQAIQTTTACGLAMVVGFGLSPQRWLWAVIAAYVVFAGVQSSGHVLIKSLQRTLGTVAGVFIGLGLAALVSGHTAVAVPLIAVLVFLTFYSFQASYTAMIFWLTQALALLYGLLGYFKPSLPCSGSRRPWWAPQRARQSLSSCSGHARTRRSGGPARTFWRACASSSRRPPRRAAPRPRSNSGGSAT